MSSLVKDLIIIIIKDGKLKVKKNVHLLHGSSNFSRPFYQVSREFGNLYS